MMPVPDKNPPPLERSRRHGEISYYDPSRWQMYTAVKKADSHYPQKHSAWWLVAIALTWVTLVLFLIYIFSF